MHLIWKKRSGTPSKSRWPVVTDTNVRDTGRAKRPDSKSRAWSWMGEYD